MKISFVSQYYNGFPLPKNFYLKSIEDELSKCVSNLFSKYIISNNSSEKEIRWADTIVCEINFLNGFVNIKGNNKELLLDAVNLNFYFNNLLPSLQKLEKDDSENFLQLKLELESLACYKEAAKISEVYFDSLKKYIDHYKSAEQFRVNPVKKFSEHLLCSEGIKGFRYIRPPFVFFPSPTIADPMVLPSKKQSKFTQCINKLPQSFISCESKKNRKLSKFFIQKAIDIKDTGTNKVLLLKQIIFFSLFKQFLFCLLSKKTYLTNSYIQKEFLKYATSKCSFSDFLILIPLACRSPVSAYCNKRISLFTSKEIVSKEISKANLAYQNIIKVFFELYKFTPEELGEDRSTSSLDQKKISQFIRGLSSLAISGGGLGRYAFYEYCLKSGEDVSENISLEIILAATESFFNEGLSSKKSHLGYFFKIFGSLPSEELKETDLAINIIKKLIDAAPVEKCIKKNHKEKYVLSKKALQNLVRFYLQGEKELENTFEFFYAKNSD